MRIFMGLTEIAGHYRNLKAGFQELGIECLFVDLDDHPFNYEKGEKEARFVRLLKTLYKRNQQGMNQPGAIRYARKISWLVFKCFFVLYVCLRYDVLIFSVNSTFWQFRDLPLLKFFKKKVIYRFHGADCRPPYLTGMVVADKDRFDVKACIKNTADKKDLLRRIENHCDLIISNPLFSQFLTRPFVCATEIGIPSTLDPEMIGKAKGALRDRENRDGVRILHAPSLVHTKGTHVIRDRIKKLKTDGYAIDYVEIKGLPNHVVLEEIARCDFVVDQLYSETPMAGFAAEAAAFSKPALVCGYALEAFRDIYPSGKYPPSLYCHPDEFEDALKKLIEDEAFRLALGEKARRFVEENWSPARVAERYLRVIHRRVPDSWWYDPGRITYVNGGCVSEKRLKTVLGEVIGCGGAEALQLTDKPALEKRFLDFAFDDSPVPEYERGFC